MGVKTTGEEIKRFYSDDLYWKTASGEDIYQDDTLFRLNGQEVDSLGANEDFKDEDKIEILSGYVASHDENYTSRDLLAFFRAWRKTQGVTSILATIPNEKLDEVKAFIKAAGGKIVS